MISGLMGIAVASGVIVTLVAAFGGIGLAIPKRFVELHGGTITAHSACAGQGAEFVVRMPVAVSPAQAGWRLTASGVLPHTAW